MRKQFARRRRLVVGGGAIVTGLVGLVLLVVLPALATTVGAPIKPPSVPKGITPIDVDTGGQSNDCAVFYPSGAKPAYQYRISNPKSGSYTTTVNGTKVTFTLVMNPANTSPSLPAYGTDKYVSFTSSGAAVADVGIKGGADTARYNYSGKVAVSGNQNYGFVTSDGYLHAPAQSVDSSGNPTSLYSLSNLTFCFDLVSTVSGTVYGDTSANGSRDTGESGLSGWTVRLYKGVTAGVGGTGTLVATTTSASDGTYALSAPSSSDLYRVCEVPPSGTWAQTQPLPSTANICTATGELFKGYDTSLTANVTGKDFGNVPSVGCSAGPFGTSDNAYLIQLATCKEHQSWVFNAGVDAGKPYASVWTADETQPSVPLVERVTWSFTGSLQNPYTVIYDDTFPFARADAHALHYCKVDPRATGSDFDLDGSYDQLSEMSAVLPTGETSCLITTTESAESASGGTFVAFIYSSIDGWRSVG